MNSHVPVIQLRTLSPLPPFGLFGAGYYSTSHIHFTVNISVCVSNRKNILDNKTTVPSLYLTPLINSQHHLVPRLASASPDYLRNVFTLRGSNQGPNKSCTLCWLISFLNLFITFSFLPLPHLFLFFFLMPFSY